MFLDICRQMRKKSLAKETWMKCLNGDDVGIGNCGSSGNGGSGGNGHNDDGLVMKMMTMTT